MTASLVPCPREGCGGVPTRYASPAEARPEQPVYWDKGYSRVCALCGAHVVEEQHGARRVPPEVAAAFRLGGEASVRALVEQHPNDYPDLHRRLVKLTEEHES